MTWLRRLRCRFGFHRLSPLGDPHPNLATWEQCDLCGRVYYRR